MDSSELVELRQGQTLLRASTLETHAFVVIDGALRLLAEEPFKKELFSVGRAEAGQLVGVVGLLRQSACEGAIARRPTKLIGLPLELISELIVNDKGLKKGLENSWSPCEGAAVLSAYLQKVAQPPVDPCKWIIQQLEKSGPETKRTEQSKELLSTVLIEKKEYTGRILSQAEKNEFKILSKLPLRYWYWEESEDLSDKHTAPQTEPNLKKVESKDQKLRDWKLESSLDLNELGLREAKSISDLQGFKPIKGKGPVAANLATLRMLAKAYETPCPVDVIEKVLEGNSKRTGQVPIHTIGQLAEAMGLQTQVGSVRFEQLHRLEFPVIVPYRGNYGLLTEVKDGKVLLADPERGWRNLPFDEVRSEWGEDVQVVLIKRLANTPTKQFGWSWFTPVIKRFQWPLVQVLLASLFIQLFQLANPLLLQQIIDKVINQSNLSALQVLGAALVVAALFQGLLTAVRTWLLIDTTDRMDLLLGSQVIDKLLRLPLRFFERRPVGELSQRLSELGNLRGFLTGTAITSALDLLFATIYILIMLMYSPLLTAVALGTVPIYVMLILFVAPIYRKLIRNQARFAAKTQSHLIETLGGIQTVKAQHFELN